MSPVLSLGGPSQAGAGTRRPPLLAARPRRPRLSYDPPDLGMCRTGEVTAYRLRHFPRSYVLFHDGRAVDVDGLLANTLGGLFGHLLAG